MIFGALNGIVGGIYIILTKRFVFKTGMEAPEEISILIGIIVLMCGFTLLFYFIAGAPKSAEKKKDDFK